MTERAIADALSRCHAYEALDLLLLPNLPVIVPDMVRQEVTQDLTKPGAYLVADWLRANSSQLVSVAPTEVFEEFMLLRSLNPATKTRNRGEQAAAEVLSRGLTGNDFGAVLLFEDSAVRKANFLVRLPDNVVVTSTSEYLFGLQSRGLVANAQAILDRAVDVRGNEILVRYLASTEIDATGKDWPKRMQPR